MALRTRPTARQDAMGSWWPSKYGADDPTLTIIANARRVAGHIAGRLGAAGRHGVRPEPVTAHA